MVETSCAICGKRLIRYKSHIRDSNFCSQECLYRWRSERARGAKHPNWKRVTLVCPICGSTFERELHRVLMYKFHFCSQRCNARRSGEMGANWRGGKVTKICPECGQEFKVRPVAVSRRRFCSRKCAVTVRLRRLAEERPNKAELRLQQIFEKHNLPYRYVGNGSFWIGSYNPDFVNVDGKKQVIELFGERWHSGIFEPAERIERFREYGFDTLIIWEKELDNQAKLVKKVRKFSTGLQAKV